MQATGNTAWRLSRPLVLVLAAAVMIAATWSAWPANFGRPQLASNPTDTSSSSGSGGSSVARRLGEEEGFALRRASRRGGLSAEATTDPGVEVVPWQKDFAEVNHAARQQGFSARGAALPTSEPVPLSALLLCCVSMLHSLHPTLGRAD